MDHLELGYHHLGHHYGYLIDKAPQNVLEELGHQINELQSDFSKGEKFNEELAGAIKHEYRIIPQPQTHQYIKNLTQQFEDESQHIVKNYESPLNLSFNDLWINFQKKYEYNPIHVHTGVLSFVIWYQIPYTFEDELKYHYGREGEENCRHGKFSFIAPHGLNKIHNLTITDLNIDNSKEGYAVIFPSSLNHEVYPFYSSDRYRITVAGNIIK
jgi:hypothetical protein